VVFRVSGKLYLVLAAASLVGAGIALVLPFSRKGSDPLLYWWVAILAFGSLGSLLRRHLARTTFLIVSAREIKIFRNSVERAVVPLDAQTNARWNWTTGAITFERIGAEPAASFVPQSSKLRRLILRAIEDRTGRARGSQKTADAARVVP
jgi:hypothetical protein